MNDLDRLKNKCEETFKMLDEKYTIISAYHIKDEKDIVLSDSENPKICRFCGKSEPEVSFNKIAHAISHMVENRHLKSQYECDECNELFAKYESDYAAYMNLYHTMFMIHGKGGIPKFKNNSKAFGKIEIDDGVVKIQVKEDEESLIVWEEEDKANNSIKIVGKRTYTPQNVLKALVKMAVSIMPKEELPVLKKTIDWLLNKEVEGMAYSVLFRFYRSVLPFTSCMVLKKKNECQEEIPKYLFVLAYRNIVIQTAIPFVEEDDVLRRKGCKLPIFPCPLDFYEEPFLKQNVRFSSSDKVRGERVEIGLRYENMVENKPDSSN